MAENCVVLLTEIREKFVICEICLDYFNDGDKLPRILPCHHSFCCRCLTSVWNNSPEGVTCPNCREVWPVQNNIEKTFPQNKVFTDLVEYKRIKNNAGEISCQVCSDKQKATTRCFDCDVYCKTCCTAVCSTCAPVSHRDHEICYLKDVYSDKKEQIRSTLYQLQTSIEKSNKLTREKQTLDETEEQSLMKIDEASKEIIKTIQDLTQQLKDEVYRNVDKQKCDRDEQIKVVTPSIKEKSEHLPHCQQTLQLARQVEFTEMFESLKKKIQKFVTLSALVERKMRKIKPGLVIFRHFEEMFNVGLKISGAIEKILNKSVVVYGGSRHMACFMQNRDKSEQNAEITNEQDTGLMRKICIGQYRKVSLPNVQFDKHIVNWKCCNVTYFGKLINNRSLLHISDPEQTSTLKCFEGVLGNKTFHHPVCYYWQVDVVCKVLDKAELHSVVAEIGVCIEQRYDDTKLISENRHAWCVSVDTCSNHNSLCLEVHSLGEEISDKPFADFEKSKQFIVDLGFLLDTKNRKLHIIRLNENKCEYSIPDIDVSKPLVPVFGVYSPDMFDVKVEIVSADQMFQNDELLKLIFNLL